MPKGMKRRTTTSGEEEGPQSTKSSSSRGRKRPSDIPEDGSEEEKEESVETSSEENDDDDDNDSVYHSNEEAAGSGADGLDDDENDNAEYTTPRRSGSRRQSKSPTSTLTSQPSVLRKTPASRKKRKLHAGRTILTVSPSSDHDFDILDRSEVPDNDTLMAMPGALGPSIRYMGSKSHLMSPLKSNSTVTSTMFSPIKTRSRRQQNKSAAAAAEIVGTNLENATATPATPLAHGGNNNNESILMSPFKMLSRLRARK